MKQTLVKYGLPVLWAVLGAIGTVGTQQAVTEPPVREKPEAQIIQIKPDCPRVPDIYLDNVRLDRKK